MIAVFHSWWAQFLEPLAVDKIKSARAGNLARAVESGQFSGVRLLEVKQLPDNSLEAVLLEIEVERPQDIAVEIRRKEPIAIVFSPSDSMPDVRALRVGFPRTIHQNYSDQSEPPSLCIDDRPWQEAKLDSTSITLLRRIQLWLVRAARGELHDSDQALEPLFYGNGIKLIVPRNILEDGEVPKEFVVFSQKENSKVLQAVPLASINISELPKNRLLAIGVKLPWIRQTRMRALPRNVDELATLLGEHNVDLNKIILDKVLAWTGLSAEHVRMLGSKLLLIAAFPIDEPGTTLDVRAFLSAETAGQLGVALGALESNSSGIGRSNTFVRRIPMGVPTTLEAIQVVPVEVHFQMDRALGSALSGIKSPDTSNLVLIGAGSLGSQLAVNLAREGRYKWTIVDDDVLLPHNFARHELFPSSTSAPKADALAEVLTQLLNDSNTAININFLIPDSDNVVALNECMARCNMVIDASASVAVSRRLADLENLEARRAAVFFNPTGTSLVILMEDRNRSCTLRDLEAQYHGLIQSNVELSTHLEATGQSFRYSGSCRSASNRIPASNAALLSALAANQLPQAFKDEKGMVGVWTLAVSGEVQAIVNKPSKVKRFEVGKWEVTVGEDFLASLKFMRTSRLPNETGGVVLGIADTSRKSMHAVHALPAPPDSVGDRIGFERGVHGLKLSVEVAQRRSMNQLTYLGEWHSHPDGSSVLPSVIDFRQFKWLSEEMRSEEIPVMLFIVGESEKFAILAADTSGVD